MPPETRRALHIPGSGGRGADYAELDAAAREAVFAQFASASRLFPGTLGFRLAEVRDGYARLEADCTPRLCQPAMVMHGGASFGLADTAVAFALLGHYGPGNILLTIEMKMSYLETINEGLVEAEAYVLRASAKSAYAEVDIWAGGRLAARATTSYMIRPFKKDAPPA